MKQTLEKIVVNAGIGRLSAQNDFESKILPAIIAEFSAIVGQKPETRSARQSIAGFKLRTGTVIGLRATLRGKRMHDFLGRLLFIALPRVRDFRGIPKKNIDVRGALTIGIREHIVFPEVRPELSKAAFGFQATLVPQNAFRTQDEAVAFYSSMGVPFER